MGIRQEQIDAEKADSDHEVRNRDYHSCVLCERNATEIHELISRSRFGSAEMDICFSPRNRVTLCRLCHTIVQGQPGWTKTLFDLLKYRYNYQYPERIFRRYGS
jgi:hypothetical protein